jgi:hypothetical protein
MIGQACILTQFSRIKNNNGINLLSIPEEIKRFLATETFATAKALKQILL